MKVYKQHRNMDDADHIGTILSYVTHVHSFLKQNINSENARYIEEYLKPDFKNSKILLNEYIDFNTNEKRRSIILQTIINIMDYCSDTINKNIDSIDVDIIKEIELRKNKLRKKKIDKLNNND